MSFTIIEDDDFNVAKACSPMIGDTMLPTNNLRYLVRQDFMQNAMAFVALPLGSPHPTLNRYFLAQETPEEHVGNGVVRWTRIHVTPPVAWDDYRMHPYNFIGYGDGTTLNAVPVRLRFTKNVRSRIRHEYFIVAPGSTYSKPEDIPTRFAQAYYYGSDTIFVDYLNNSPVDTTPTLDAYLGWIGGGSTGAAGAQGGEIIAEDSTLEQVIGPLYVRITRYVRAQ